jgi:acyl-CoA reductase-like NAD-dependent aldehyde dehydrogenase
MAKDDASLLRELKRLTKGLEFQSESDYPVEPFAPDSWKPDASARAADFDNFFAAAAEEQDWQDADARARVRKFQALVKYLKENLADIQVYKVGDTEADVYVVGKTASGKFAGVKTKVVET